MAISLSPSNGDHTNLPSYNTNSGISTDPVESENNGDNIFKMMMSDSEADMDDCKPSEKAGEYVRELLMEKQSLDSSQWPNALRLLDQEVTKEVARVQASGKPLPKESKYVDIYREKPIRVAVKVLVPIKEHPKFNFVGKLLGPKGNSMKRLQEDTMTKMAVLGRGSMKDKQKEEDLRASLDPKYAHLSDDLHVEIAAFAPPAEAHARIAYALAEVRKYLIPDSNDEIRQEQMREMELIQTVTSDSPPGANGTQAITRKPAYPGGNSGVNYMHTIGHPPRGRGHPRGGGHPLNNHTIINPVDNGRFRWPTPGSASVSHAQAGYAPQVRGRMASRGTSGLRGGGGGGGGGGAGNMVPAMRPSRGLLTPPSARGRKPPPQALLPRPTASKTKVLSILDRARVAMEESYGYEEELAGSTGGFYEAPAYESYTTTGYSGGYDDFEDASAEYYDSAETYPGEEANRWKGFKQTLGPRSERAQYRAAPYARPTKN